MTTGAGDALDGEAAACERRAARSGCWGSTIEYLRTHPTEFIAYICDAATAVLVVAVQDVCLKEAITACAVLAVVSLLCNWDSKRRGQRVVFPKSIEIMVPAICIGLVVPAWINEEATHRVVYLVICGTAATTMLITVLIGRSFAMEYFMDWYPREFWGTPLVKRLTSHLAWVWIIGQTIMAGAAAVVLVTGTKNEALYITMNYVLQLLPLVVSVAATVAYPKILKRAWGYDPSDVTTGYPPSQRAALFGSGAGGGSLTGGLDATSGPSAVASGASRRALLGGFEGSSGGGALEAGGAAACGGGRWGLVGGSGGGGGGGAGSRRTSSSAGDPAAVVVSPVVTPAWRAGTKAAE